MKNTWNYRFLAVPDGDEYVYTLYEVHYCDGIITSRTTNPANITLDDMEGIAWLTGKLKEAAKKPILSLENFPKEHKDAGLD